MAYHTIDDEFPILTDEPPEELTPEQYAMEQIDVNMDGSERSEYEKFYEY